MTFAQFVQLWPGHVGPQIAAVARPAAFVVHTNTLHVRVDTHTWRSELSALARELTRGLPDIDGLPVARIVFLKPLPHSRGRQ